MHSRTYILAIDFDMTITKGDHIPRSWGDRLAKRLRHIQQLYPVEVLLLSVANMSHIYHVLLYSGSPQLLTVMMDIPMTTNESPNLARVNRDWGEDKKTRDKMIRTVAHSEDMRDLDLIVAYKKTNFLIRRSGGEIPHSHVFLLDDNHHNIRFARYYGFRAYQVDNQDRQKTIFRRLRQVEDVLRQHSAKKHVS